MEFEEFSKGVISRYSNLKDSEKEEIRRLNQTKAVEPLLKVLGPEFSPLLKMLAAPKPKKGLGARR